MAILQISTNLLGDYFEYSFDYPRKGILPIPIGYSAGGLEVIDIAKLPHMLIGGTTGGGKSNAIHVIVNSLLSLQEPPVVVVVDLKMSEYNYLENRVLLVTEQESTCQCLARLVQEMRSRQLLLKESRCVDIKKYHQHGGKMQYIVLVIDELAELKDKDAQEDLETLLRLCRASGICIVAATQRPSSKIFGSKSFGDAKANFGGTLCFRTKSEVDSRVIMDSGEAAGLPAVPGRGYLRVGCDLMLIQSPYLDPEVIPIVDQFSPGMLRAECKGDSDTDRVGGVGHSAINPFGLPFLASGAKAIKSIIGKW
jgi:S-DNA-T family DNA segregation ATPase FtsK/SpoIIIE